MLAPGDMVPHFQVTNSDGAVVAYSSIWQRRNLVLVTLSATASQQSCDYVSQLADYMPEFRKHDAACVVTRDHVPGCPTPGVVIADRWGEIVQVAAAPDIADLRGPRELLEWIEYLQNQCPECQGEAR
jgi:hypothetical protein